jgi:hypothetical protein
MHFAGEWTWYRRDLDVSDLVSSHREATSETGSPRASQKGTSETKQLEPSMSVERDVLLRLI